MTSSKDPVWMNDGSAAAKIDLYNPLPTERIGYSTSYDATNNISIELFFAKRCAFNWVVAEKLIVDQTRIHCRIGNEAEKEHPSLH